MEKIGEMTQQANSFFESMRTYGPSVITACKRGWRQKTLERDCGQTTYNSEFFVQ